MKKSKSWLTTWFGPVKPQPRLRYQGQDRSFLIHTMFPQVSLAGMSTFLKGILFSRLETVSYKLARRHLLGCKYFRSVGYQIAARRFDLECRSLVEIFECYHRDNWSQREREWGELGTTRDGDAGCKELSGCLPDDCATGIPPRPRW